MDTLTSRIEVAAQRGGTLTVISGDTHVSVPWSEMLDQARAVAAALQARGIGPGDHVALLGPTTRSLITAIEATWLAGACVMVLPLPMRMSSLEAFVDATRTRVRAGDAAVLLVDPDLAEFVEREPGDPPFVLLSELVADAERLGAGPYVRPDDDPDRLAILQFTSGSTSHPKGVMLPHRVMGANLDGIRQVTDYSHETDTIVSWLPLYHDMGLVGLFGLSITEGGNLVQGAPQDFMARPARWMEWLSTYGGTATAGPNFAWVLATRTLKHHADTLDLSPLRVALNGAEPVDPAAVRAFVAAAERHGMRPGAVFPAFGMAEVAIAGTFPPPMAGLRTDVVDKRVLETERYAAPVAAEAEGAKELALLGTPIPGLEMRIVDPETGRRLSGREVGELEIRGTSVTTGYYNNADATEAAFHDGWLRTGDLAYFVEDELVICGRIKDVIILAGRNIFPDDIERAVAGVDGVRAGNIIAFGVPGRRGLESVAVVAEVKESDHRAVIDEIHRRVREVAGTPPHDVVLVSPGTLPKTSSGKLQRVLCRQRYLAGELEPVAAHR